MVQFKAPKLFSVQTQNHSSDLLDIFFKSPSVHPKIRLLRSENDNDFVQGLRHCLIHAKPQSSSETLLFNFGMSISSTVHSILKSMILERITRIIRQSKDGKILTEILPFAHLIDKLKMSSSENPLKKSMLLAAASQTTFEIFQIFLRFIKLNQKEKELENNILEILNLGKNTNVDSSAEQKIKAKFQDIQSKDDLKHLRFVCLLNLQKHDTQFKIQSTDLNQLLAEFKEPRTQKSQRLLDLAIFQNVPEVISLIQGALSSKFIVEPKVQYQIDAQQLHPSFITKENIIAFDKHIVANKGRDEIAVYFDHGSVIEVENGIYIKLPAESYPKILNLQINDLDEQIPSIFNFIKLVCKSITESKPMFSAFEELTIKDKLHLLSFAFSIVTVLPEYESEEEPYDFTEVFESGIIAETLTAIMKIMESNDKFLHIEELQDVVRLVFKNALIFPLNQNNITQFVNTKAIDKIYKIVTGFKNSVELTSDIIYLYEKGMKEVLRISNKTQEFQTPVLFEKLVESCIIDKTIKHRMNRLIEQFIVDHPEYEIILKKQILLRATFYFEKPQQYFDDPSNQADIFLMMDRLMELISLKVIKCDADWSKFTMKFYRLKFQQSKFTSPHLMLITNILHKDLVMNAEEFNVALNQALELLSNNEEFKKQFTLQNLLEPVKLPIHTNFINHLHIIINYIRHQDKDAVKTFESCHDKLFKVILAFLQQQFLNIQLVKNHIKSLTPEQMTTFNHNQQAKLLFKQNTLVEYLDGAKSLLSLQIQSLLRNNSKVLPAAAAKIPLQPFLKQFRVIFDRIKDSTHKEQIIYYIEFLSNAFNFNHKHMSVQCYYYLYAELHKDLFAIVNKLFAQSKMQSYVKTFIPSPKSFVIKLWIQNEEEFTKNEQDSLEVKFRHSISDFIGTFVLKKLTVLPWINENSSEVKYSNSRNLALGIILEQFTQLIKNLTKENIVVYEDILKEFLSPNIQKTYLADQDTNIGSNNRRGNNLRAHRQVTEVLLSMGYTPQVVELALNDLQEVNIEGALEWLGDHHNELDALEDQMISEYSMQRFPNKQKSSKSDSKGVLIQQIQLEKFNSEYMTQLKSLFTQHLLPGLYGKYKDRMPQLIICCVERFDKQQSRNKNYKNFINYLIKQLNTDLVGRQKLKQLDQQRQDRVNVQLSNLELIIQKCANKKDIKDQALQSNLISNLLVLTEHYTNKQKLSKKEETNVGHTLSIIFHLIPKNSAADINVQIDSILDKLIALKQKFQSLKDLGNFWSIVNTRLRSKVSNSRLLLIIDLLFKDIGSNSMITNPGEIIESILNQNQDLVAANIQAQIKAYFHSEGEAKLVSKTRRQFLLHFERYNNNTTFYEISKKILKKKTEKLHNNKKVVYLIYSKQKQSFTESLVLKKPFIEYSPNKIEQALFEKIFSSLSNTQKIPQASNKIKLDLLHRILERFPLLQHYYLFNKYKESTLLQLLIDKIPEYRENLDNLFTLFGASLGLMVAQKGRVFPYSHYLQYQALKLFQQAISNKQNSQNSRYVSLCFLIQFSFFNSISNVAISESIPSLQSTLEQNFEINNEFIFQPLMLIYKQTTLKAISGLYTLLDPQNLSLFESQLIYLPLIYSSLSDESSTGNKSISRLRSQFSEIDELRDAHTLLNRLERTQGNISRLIELFRRNEPLGALGGDSHLEFFPIQPKSERKESKVSNSAQVVEKSIVVQQIKEQIVEKVRYLSEEYMQIPVLVSTQITQEQPIADNNKPNYSKMKSSQNPIPQTEYKISYSTKFTETFLTRTSSMWKLINSNQQKPEVAVVEEKNKNQIKAPVQGQIPRHLIAPRLTSENPFQSNAPRRDSLQEVLAYRQQRNRANMMMQFNIRRRQNQQQQHQLNENLIQSILEQYVEEKPKQQPKVEKKEEEKVEKKEQPKEVQDKNYLIPVPKQEEINKEVPETKIQEKVEQKIAEKVEEKAQQKIQLKKEQKAQTKQQTDKKQQKQEVVPQKKQQVEKQKQEKKQQLSQKKQEEKQKQQEKKQQVPPPAVPVVPVQNRPTNPPRYRQLLELIGVSQHFLRNNGVNEQQFDSWSEEIQTETLFQLISLQNEHHEEAKNEQHQPYVQQDVLQNIPAEVRDQIGFGMYTETAMLLASMDDPQIREQIFLQASPQVISSLPIELQQQAEVVRQRRMREIAAEEEEEYNNNIYNRRRPKRNKQNLIYPVVPKQLFKGASEEILFKIVKTLFVKHRFPNSMLLESCIQNKQNQQTLINTLLYILRNPLACPEFPIQIKQITENGEKVLPDGAKLLTNLILSSLQKIVKHCPYKDSKFLKQKISYKGLLQIKLPPKQEFFVQNLVNQEFHHPFIELLSHSLPANLSLSAYLLEGYPSAFVPKSILQKIIETFRSDNLSSDFVTSLKSIEDNKELKQLFKTSFTEKNHPKINVLAQLLKYSFARVDYLKDLHLKILKNYRPEFNKFLNEIYRIYTLEEIKEIKDLVNYKHVHKQVIKDIISHSNIFAEPISIILKLPFLIDFETKRQIFYQKVQMWNEEGGYMGRLQLRIDRLNLFSGSFSQIYPRTKQEMRGKLNITFEDEGAYDAGGLTREWFLIISKEMFNQDYALFEQSSSGNTYHPSSKSYVNPDHLRYFKFIGRIVGKALMQKCYIDAFFTRSFYKLILGQDLTLSDMQSSDFNFYTSMMWVKNNHIEDDFYRFAYDIQNFGKIETIELVPNGKNIEVTEANKHDFVQKICLVKMKTQTQQQIKAFLEGFHELIPLESIQYFTSEELQLLMSGLPEIDLNDLKQNTEYQGYQPTDKQIVWFWEILSTFDQQQLAKVVQFITGTSKIPPEGFKGLKGMHGGQKISIHKHFGAHQLPQSHTCFNQLDLPEYTTKEVMEKMLKTALKWGSESFGFM